MKKTQLLETIHDMPEDIAIDELIERLLIIDKIEKGKQQVSQGKVSTDEEARQKLEHIKF